jgi:hypothetical protein
VPGRGLEADDARHRPRQPRGDAAWPREGPPGSQAGAAAADLFGKGEGYYLDSPGNPLRPRWYDRDGKRFGLGRSSIAYARIFTEHGNPGEPRAPGRLALQYWFFYYFNNFNDRHEADWEGVQLVFKAGSTRQALLTQPVEVGYAQHTGGEQADWDSEKVEKVGDDPIVYSAAGSGKSPDGYPLVRVNDQTPEPVTIALSRASVEIPWESREKLLDRASRLAGGEDVAQEFEAAGASQPVELTAEGKQLVLDVVSFWLRDSGIEELPEGIFELRNALEDDRAYGETEPPASWSE